MPVPCPPRRRAHALCAAFALAALTACAVTSTTSSPSPSPSSSDVINPAPDDAPATLEARFARWLDDLRIRAKRAGIDEATLERALAGVRYLSRTVERDRAQPEFTRTVWDYLDIAVSPQRVTFGRDKLQQVRTDADAAAQRHGVPPQILLAIWGIESNYGSDTGSVPVIDALATLGFDGRREAWAREQLIAALKILQRGDIEPARMVGSWAGAMGQTQFMPSAYLAYAVDGDGDGRRDLWDSAADVLASTANFLARSGWQPGLPWGLEVRLPEGFDMARADDALRQPATRWADEGVRSIDGAPLPDVGDASILLPAGARGPAFLVGPNFRALLRYNNSTSYALAVALLAQRLADGPGVQAAWPRDQAALSRSQLLALQAALNERGFDAGAVDGLLGPATRAAVRRYQRSAGLPVDGYPTAELLQRLQAP